MARAAPLIEAFNAGELAPELAGRVSIGKYQSGCSTLENFIPLVQGPARKRAGTRFVLEVPDSSKRHWLAKFEFNTEQAYVLEFGNLTLRFYTDNGILLDAGLPYVVTTPWSNSDLIAADGTFALKMVQSGDVLYICHPSYAPRKLTRTGATTWTLTTLSTEAGPFADYDPDQTTTVYASAATGAGVTVTASASAFASTDVGRLIYLEQKKANSVKAWESAKAVTINALRRSDGKTYKALNSATTGTVRPTHTSGSEYDGDNGVQWEYQDPGYGWGVITGYTSATVVTITVSSRLPGDVVGSGNATTRWALGAWGSVPGYPSHVTFYRNRLCFARAIDRKLWFSVAADYENFADRDDGGRVTADMAISVEVDSDQSNAIQFITPADGLIIGTAASEHICREMTDSEPFGPANVTIVKASTYGSRGVEPVRVGDSTLFVQRSGRKLRELTYDDISQKYPTLDMSILAPHMCPKGTAIRQLAFQQEPHSIIWAARDDGALLGFTFNREQYTEPPYGGWHRHELGGSGIVESIVALPSPDQGRDDLWMIVRRTINGATQRYVEYMETEYEDGDDQEDAFYVDCGLSYDGAPATTFSGLDHLEGATVAVLADGSVHPDCVVTSGDITLTRSASVVHAGLAYTAKLATMRLNAGAADGTAQGKIKRISEVSIRLLDTLGGKLGPEETKVDEILFRSAANAMNQPVPIFTGDKRIHWRGDYETDAIVWFVHDQPLPATVVAIMPIVQSQER